MGHGCPSHCNGNWGAIERKKSRRNPKSITSGQAHEALDGSYR